LCSRYEYENVSHFLSVLMQRSFGSCNADFIFSAGAPAGGYCAATCGRCPTAASQAAAPAPAPAVVNCDDVAPDSQYTCEELQSMGNAIQRPCLSLLHLLGATALPPVAAAPQPLPLPQAALLAAPPPQLLPLHLLIRPVMCQLLSSRCLPPPLRPPLRPRQLPQS